MACADVSCTTTKHKLEVFKTLETMTLDVVLHHCDRTHTLAKKIIIINLFIYLFKKKNNNNFFIIFFIGTCTKMFVLKYNNNGLTC